MLLDSIKLSCIIFVCALHLSYVCLFACVYFGSSRVDDGSDGSDEYDYYLYFRLCFQARLTGEHFHLLTCYIQYMPMHTYVLCLPRIRSCLRYLSDIHKPILVAQLPYMAIPAATAIMIVCLIPLCES